MRRGAPLQSSSVPALLACIEPGAPRLAGPRSYGRSRTPRGSNELREGVGSRPCFQQWLLRLTRLMLDCCRSPAQCNRRRTGGSMSWQVSCSQWPPSKELSQALFQVLRSGPGPTATAIRVSSGTHTLGMASTAGRCLLAKQDGTRATHRLLAAARGPLQTEMRAIESRCWRMICSLPRRSKATSAIRSSSSREACWTPVEAVRRAAGRARRLRRVPYWSEQLPASVECPC